MSKLLIAIAWILAWTENTLPGTTYFLLKPVEINFVPIAVGLSEVVGRAVGLLVPITRQGNVNKQSRRRVGIIASQSQRNRSRAPKRSLFSPSQNGILMKNFLSFSSFCVCLEILSDALAYPYEVELALKLTHVSNNYYISRMTRKTQFTFIRKRKEHSKSSTFT